MPQKPARFPRIDGFEFAAAGGILRGEWPVSVFPRLRDVLHDDSGTVGCEVRGGRDAHGRAFLAVRTQAGIRLACQRCLAAVDWRVEADSTLLLAASQAEIDADPVSPEMPDRIVAQKEMRVLDLIEDELLLALPLAPRHESCPAPGKGAPGEERHTPFSGLRGLVRGRNGH